MNVVIGNHTVMDGFVIRWYSSEASATHGREIISASRNGVQGGPGTNLTPELFEAAWKAHQKMIGKRVNSAEFTDILTHTRDFSSGEVSPIQKGANDGE